MNNILSNDFKVACQIYEMCSNGNPATHKSIYDCMQSVLTKEQISESIDTLRDWGVIMSKCVKTENGYIQTFYISNGHKERIRDLYENFIERKYK